MAAPERLITINSARAMSCPPMSMAIGPIADKFFLVGAIASVVGVAWLGTHLWLALSGQVVVTESYGLMRRAHIAIQFYLFVGMFVLGFIGQAGPKLIGSPRGVSHLTLLWIPLMIAGVLLRTFTTSTFQIGGTVLIAGAFLSAAFYVVRFRKTADAQLRWAVGNFLLFGLTVFAVSPFLDIEDRAISLFVLWAGLAALVFGTGQQFIAAFLGGTRCNATQSKVLQSLFLGSAFSLAAACVWGNLWWNVGGATSALTLLYYAWSTQLYNARKTMRADGLALAFTLGYLWALGGATLLALNGAPELDSVLHIWATGWVAPLIIAVSGQILSAMSGKVITRNGFFTVALLFWQLIPIGRSLAPVVRYAPWFSWVVTVDATVVLALWVYALTTAEISLLKRVFPQYRAARARAAGTVLRAAPAAERS